MMNKKFPLLQVALDFVDLDRAIKVAHESVSGGVDIIEVGTPLIKSEGLNAVRKIKTLFPDKKIVADMKIMDAGRIEVESAAKSGANIIDVLGVSSDSTIVECIKAGKNYGAEIMVDMINVKDVLKRVKEVEKLGADFVGIHISIDKQMQGETSFKELKEVTKIVKIPVAVAGGINSETIADAIKAGASIVIVGGAITKSADAKSETVKIKKAMLKKIKIKTEFYKRVGIENIFNILSKVSSANISDAMHRGGFLEGISPVFSGIKMIGRAVTVRTYPGDWAKSVEAIDIAKKGDCIVIDAGGVGPAVWGELATVSSVRKKLSGVVINGAIRDVKEINMLKFPAFSKLITSSAGEPKGFGEINVPINISGSLISSGDYIIGDDDGVVVIPEADIVEVTNRAMDVLEKENRIRKEIIDGGTLSSVMELLKWEKKS